MQKIYRLEHTERKSQRHSVMAEGIYRCGLANHLVETAFESGRSPAPREDVKLSWQWEALDDCLDWYFGFESIESLKRWFYDESNLEFYSDMYLLSVYEVPNYACRIGTAQAIFNHKEIISRTVLDNSILWSNNNEQD